MSDDALAIALRAILQTAITRVDWGEAEFEVWVRQLRAAARIETELH